MVCCHSLEEDSKRRLGGAAPLGERRRIVEIDLDMRGEDECRADVVPGTHELFEAPPKNHLCLCLVD